MWQHPLKHQTFGKTIGSVPEIQENKIIRTKSHSSFLKPSKLKLELGLVKKVVTISHISFQAKSKRSSFIPEQLGTFHRRFKEEKYMSFYLRLFQIISALFITLRF